MNKVIARLTAIRANGQRTIVEVNQGATFHSFYHYYIQDGLKRSTKRELRTASRNEGLPHINAHLHMPGLEAIARKLQAYTPQANPVASIKIRIIRKREYRRLITASPDVLGLVKVSPMRDPRLLPKPVLRYPVHIPASHTPIKRRVSILLGRR